VRGLKPLINAPLLVTYHECGCTISESFPAPIPSLVEYGVYDEDRKSHSAATRWHSSFPNILKLSIRAGHDDLVTFLRSLAYYPHSVPALQMISAGSSSRWGAKVPKEYKKSIEHLIQERSKACLKDIMLNFELGQPLHSLPSTTVVSHLPHQITFHFSDSHSSNRVITFDPLWKPWKKS
jgi:hypothetical protein